MQRRNGLSCQAKFTVFIQSIDIIILKKYATTGDGLLTALMITEEMCERKAPLSKLTEEVRLYPQVTVNVRVTDQAAVMADAAVGAVMDEVEREIDGNGRVLLRKSGTEPIVRVMVEAVSEECCRAYAERIADSIRGSGYACE